MPPFLQSAYPCPTFNLPVPSFNLPALRNFDLPARPSFNLPISSFNLLALALSSTCTFPPLPSTYLSFEISTCLPVPSFNLATPFFGLPTLALPSTCTFPPLPSTYPPFVISTYLPVISFNLSAPSFRIDGMYSTNYPPSCDPESILDSAFEQMFRELQDTITPDTEDFLISPCPTAVSLQVCQRGYHQDRN